MPGPQEGKPTGQPGRRETFEFRRCSSVSSKRLFRGGRKVARSFQSFCFELFEQLIDGCRQCFTPEILVADHSLCVENVDSRETGNIPILEDATIGARPPMRPGHLLFCEEGSQTP